VKTLFELHTKKMTKKIILCDDGKVEEVSEKAA